MGEGSVLQNGPVAELLNKGGTPVVKTGEEIKRVLVVEKMEIQNITGTGQTKEAELKVKIKKLGVANAGMITERVFGLTVELDSAGKITRCHHTLDSKEHGIKTAMCTEMGGEMVTDPGGGAGTVCSISGLYKKHCESLGGTYTAPPATGTSGDQRIGTCDMNPVLQKFCTSLQGSYTAGTPVGTCDIAPVYVDTAGDTVTGTLISGGCTIENDSITCPKDVSAGGDISAGANVSAGVNVSAGAAVSSASVSASGNISAGGTVSAGGTGGGTTTPTPTPTPTPNPTPIVPGTNCPAGEVVTGIDTSGNPICSAILPPGLCFAAMSSCPAGYTERALAAIRKRSKIYRTFSFSFPDSFHGDYRQPYRSPHVRAVFCCK